MKYILITLLLVSSFSLMAHGPHSHAIFNELSEIMKDLKNTHGKQTRIINDALFLFDDNCTDEQINSEPLVEHIDIGTGSFIEIGCDDLIDEGD